MQVTDAIAETRLGSRGATFGTGVAVTLSAFAMAVVVLDPIWDRLRPPFVTPLSSPRVAAPVDGPFYIRNAVDGFRWSAKAPDSLWFHPLMSLVVRALKPLLRPDLGFWSASVFFGVGAVYLLVRVGHLVLPNVTWNTRTTFLLLLCPGMLSLGVGNPEVPTLFFGALLLLLVLERRAPSLIAGVAALAILTKPTALALVPAFALYGVHARRRGDTQLLRSAVVAVGALAGTWLGWAAFVGLKSHDLWAYWEARASFSQYVPGNPSRFLEYASTALRGEHGLRDFVRFGSALLAPTVSLFVVAASRGRDRVHAEAQFAAIWSILLFMVWTGNPNKVVLYLLTLPGQGLFHVEFVVRRTGSLNHRRRFGRAAYIGYCLSMLLVFAVGTPLGWYY